LEVCSTETSSASANGHCADAVTAGVVMPEVWVACAESPRGMIPQQGRAASRGIGGDGADEGAQEGSKVCWFPIPVRQQAPPLADEWEELLIKSRVRGVCRWVGVSTGATFHDMHAVNPCVVHRQLCLLLRNPS
jgi:hypothetical protein